MGCTLEPAQISFQFFLFSVLDVEVQNKTDRQNSFNICSISVNYYTPDAHLILRHSSRHPPPQKNTMQSRSLPCRATRSSLMLHLCVCVAERRRRQPQLCGHRGRAGGLLPQPEDSAAVRTHQLCPGHQQSGKVSFSARSC